MKHLSFFALVASLLFALPIEARAEGAAMESSQETEQQQKMRKKINVS